MKFIWEIWVKKIQGSSYVSIDESAAIVCAISKDYQKPSFRYWYSFHPYQANFLTKYKQGFVVLGCGSPENIFAIPFREFKPWIGKLNTTKRKDGTYYYHIRVSVEASGFHLQFQGRGKMEDITRFRLKYLGASPAASTNENALDDLSDVPEGSRLPDRATVITNVIKRDNRVRAYVLERANGRCEFCHVQGFLTVDGGYYLEAHHIISLCDSGCDTVENVIALCPQHHRQAHFGVDAESLETEFVNILKKLTSDV